MDSKKVAQEKPFLFVWFFGFGKPKLDDGRTMIIPLVDDKLEEPVDALRDEEAGFEFLSQSEGRMESKKHNNTKNTNQKQQGKHISKTNSNLKKKKPPQRKTKKREG